MLPLFLMAALDTKEEIDKLEALYNATNKMLYRYALSLLKNHEAAEDVVQEAYLYIANHMEKITDPYCKSSANYMLIYTKYKILRLLGKQKQAATEALEEEAMEIVGMLSVEDEVVRLENLMRMTETIKTLKESYRQILTYYYYLDYSVNELATELSITPDNVLVRLHRARTALKNKLMEGAIGRNAQ